ncbi:hypothetical protein [Clostridium aciditolerans]|uniref:Uncharacterized protein n=1 Tax=Clostridium aciditolerans TaxID=339861 RepID=A0A934M9B1_9CLOT|nr:hypothetical protein [Clostridium aciditolerans]MBI6875626.1 hypothetical protein [Clostridium aciditolerans]
MPCDTPAIFAISSLVSIGLIINFDSCEISSICFSNSGAIGMSDSS